MTDRVIEIRLSAPRPNLLQLLAQPEFALSREGLGTGPFQPEVRTGANPDLFADVAGADVCTDPKCFHTKVEAHDGAQMCRPSVMTGVD